MQECLIGITNQNKNSLCRVFINADYECLVFTFHRLSILYGYEDLYFLKKKKYFKLSLPSLQIFIIN